MCDLKQVLDEDIGDDKLLGVVKLPLNDLEPDKTEELELRLLPSLNMLKIKDKKDRGTITVKVHKATNLTITTEVIVPNQEMHAWHGMAWINFRYVIMNLTRRSSTPP